MIGQTSSFAVQGIQATPVSIEVDISPGLPSYQVVGLPSIAVKEGASRIRAALRNAGHALPAARITINLAPGDIRKDEPCLDFPIAIALLIANKKIPQSSANQRIFWGELGLDGALRGWKGALSVAMAANKEADCCLLLGPQAASQAALINSQKSLVVSHLGEAIDYLRGSLALSDPVKRPEVLRSAPLVDLRDIAGQEFAKCALEVAAAGGHNLLMTGPPGVGKTMLAQSLPGILPPLSNQEQLESTLIRSARGVPVTRLNNNRPFVSPHHTISNVGMVGGGNPITPGQISMAHGGVLFLDEIPEFPKYVLETLRQPLESGAITINRNSGQSTIPANFQMVATANPCPCGNAGNGEKFCGCSPRALKRYGAKLSGPLLDRIDIRIALREPSLTTLLHEPKAEASATVRNRVIEARAKQIRRLKAARANCNAQLSASEIRTLCKLKSGAVDLLTNPKYKHRIGSARSAHRIIRVAQTIADLRDEQAISRSTILEALIYRIGWVEELECKLAS